MLLRAVIFWGVVFCWEAGGWFFCGRTLKDSSLTLNMTPRHPAGAGEGLFQRDISFHSERTANPRRDAAFLEKLSFVTI